MKKILRLVVSLTALATGLGQTPNTAKLLNPIPFSIVIDGRVAGNITASKGTEVTIVKQNADKVLVELNGSSNWVDKSNLLMPAPTPVAVVVATPPVAIPIETVAPTLGLAGSLDGANSTTQGEQEITISGFIDGSDEFAFTPGKVTWKHKFWGVPTKMKFGDDIWTDLKRTPQKWIDMKDLDISKAHITQRSGRDVITLETNQDGFILYFCDSPNGGENYSVTISIPPKM